MPEIPANPVHLSAQSWEKYGAAPLARPKAQVGQVERVPPSGWPAPFSIGAHEPLRESLVEGIPD